MSHSFLLEGSRLQLVNQLVYFDEQKQDFLDHYYPGYTKERTKIEQMLSDYTAMLEKILADFNKESLYSTVLIGSQIKIFYVEDGSTEVYSIVFPNQAEPGQNKISFLSPVGSQLLLARMNESYQLKTPSGGIEVRLQEIKYHNCGELSKV